jgi:tetratricopeptide (TPR) repeat protein
MGRIAPQRSGMCGTWFTCVTAGKVLLSCLVCICCALADDSNLLELQRRVDAAIADNKPAEAVELLNAGLKQNPEWREGWWRLGSVLYQADRYAQARPVFEHLAVLDSKVGAPWVFWGLCEFEAGDYGLALQHLERGQALGFPSALNLTGVARYHEALALIVTGKFEQAQVLLNFLAREKGTPEEVIVANGLATLQIPVLPQTIRKALDRERFALIVKVGKAQQLIALRKTSEAVAEYKKLLSQYPTFPSLHLIYASLLVQVNEFEEARTQFRLELKVNPKSMLARVRFVLLELDRKKSVSDEVASLAREAVALEPGSYIPHYVLGLVLVREGKLDEAANELEISRDLDPYSSRVRFELAKVDLRLDRKEAAAKEQKVFEELQPIDNSFREFGKLPASVYEGDPVSAGAGPGS